MLGAHQKEFAGSAQSGRQPFGNLFSATTGTAFAVWAPNARGVRVIGDFNHWDGRTHPMRSLGGSGVWELFVPGVGEGDAVQVRDLRSGRRVAGQGRPAGRAGRGAAGHGLGGHRLAARVGRRRVDGGAEGPGPAGRADERVRGAHRVLATGAVLPGTGRPADRVRDEARVHARGVPAGGRAPVRRLLGVPGHLVLRAVGPVRIAGRLPLPGGPAAPGRDRRARGLGARALPARRLGAGPVRRHAAVRGPRSAARRAPGLGHADLQLRPERGAQLPGRERGLLAGGVPRGRAAGGRGRLHAVPGLLPAARRVDAERVRREPEPGGGRVPAGGQRHLLPALARHHDGGRGVHRLARGHPAGVPGRARLRHEVEHGLDARHAGLPGPRSGVPAIPPQRADVLAGVRVQRELRAAALARRGGARQGLAARQDARRRLAPVRRAAGAAGLHVGAPGQAAAVHGVGVRPGRGVVGRARAGLVGARRRDARRGAAAGAGHERRLPGPPGPVGAGHLAGRVQLDRRQRRGGQHAVVPAAVPGRRRAGVRGELLRRAAPRLPARPAVGRAVARGDQHRRRHLRRQRGGQPRRDRGDGRALARPPGLGHDQRAAAGRALAGPRERGRDRRLRASRRGEAGGRDRRLKPAAGTKPTAGTPPQPAPAKPTAGPPPRSRRPGPVSRPGSRRHLTRSMAIAGVAATAMAHR